MALNACLITLYHPMCPTDHPTALNAVFSREDMEQFLARLGMHICANHDSLELNVESNLCGAKLVIYCLRADLAEECRSRQLLSAQ
eukprot:2229430-Amphidinium_carterae.1